jgi:hypothetical protein
MGIAAGRPRFGPESQGVACAGIGAELHVLVAKTPSLLHTIRHADGTWQRFGNVNDATGFDGELLSPFCAAIGDELHVCAKSGLRIVHTIRHADGSWDDVGVLPPGPVVAQAGQAAACALAGELHVFAAENIMLGHTVRHRNGHWDPWGDISPAIRNKPAFIIALAAATVDTEIHVAVIGTADDARVTGVINTVYHALRRIGGAWTPFASVFRETGNPGIPSQGIAVAGVNEELHLAFTTITQPYLWHAIRHADGTWTRFGDVPAATGRPGTDLIWAVELAGVQETPGLSPCDR